MFTFSEYFRKEIICFKIDTKVVENIMKKEQ